MRTLPYAAKSAKYSRSYKCNYNKEKTMVALNEGDILEFKKTHPCGGSKWKILRVGSDCRLECTTCGHQIEITRSKLEKNIKIRK